MIDREKVIKGLNCCSSMDGHACLLCPYASECSYEQEYQTGTAHLASDALALLKDRTKDYEAWAKEIGVDTCVNCRHASFNRNDGKSTCPIEHHFALVKDGYCHLFIRVEGR